MSMSSNALERVTPTSLDTVEVDFSAVLKEFKLDPDDPKAHAIVYLARTYQLDPLLREIMLLEDGSIFIGHKGRIRQALDSPELVAFETTDPWTGGEEDPDWHCRATVVVHRHGRDVAFTRTGRSSKVKHRKGGGTYPDPKAPERAEANAEYRALVRAFPIRLPSQIAAQLHVDVVEPAGDDDGGPVQATLSRVVEQLGEDSGRGPAVSSYDPGPDEPPPEYDPWYHEPSEPSEHTPVQGEAAAVAEQESRPRSVGGVPPAGEAGTRRRAGAPNPPVPPGGAGSGPPTSRSQSERTGRRGTARHRRE
jgi:hypothetical protein